jgi:Transposase zinc-ribbon domain/ISXO2-like transposase domain
LLRRSRPYRVDGQRVSALEGIVNIREIFIKFSTDEQCLEYIEKMRWPDGVVRCTVCGATGAKRVERKAESKNKRGWFYLCSEPTCRNQFSPTAGTLFHDTHLPLITWFHAIALILNAKKGISAMQLQRDLGIGGYKTAWYLNHRIREAMKDGFTAPLGGIVEIDETYIGGRVPGRNQRLIKAKKKVVIGAVQRGGEYRFNNRKTEDVFINTIERLCGVKPLQFAELTSD